MKNKILILATALLALTLGACGGAYDNTAATTVSPVSGNAVKGPFKAGSLVTATKLNADGTATTTMLQTNTTDDTGKYTLDANWSGLTEVTITGNYLDETDGSTKNGTVSAIIVLPANGGAVTANPNLASSMSANIAKNALAANPGADPATTVQNSDAAVSSALGLPKGSDLASLNVLKPGAANEQLLIVSAVMQDAVNNNAAADMDTLIAGLATDVEQGKAVGSTSGATAVITTSTASVNVATITTNLATVGTTVDQTALTSAQTTVTANIQTTLKGLAMASNTFTLGTSSFAIEKTGVATQTGSTPAANTVFAFALADNTGITTATTYNTTFTLDIAAAAAADNRQISASVPVTIVTDGAGAISATVAANAVFTYAGTDTQGAGTNGTATNIASNAIQTSASNVSVDLGALITTIKTKLGANAAAFNVLNTKGDYTFAFSFSGIDIGSADAAGTGITQLFPVTAAGRGVSGTVTIQ